MKRILKIQKGISQDAPTEISISLSIKMIHPQIGRKQIRCLLNCLRQESSSDWEEADQMPLNCLRQELSSDWEEADQMPLNCLRQESSSDWEEADQMPLNCLRQESSSQKKCVCQQTIKTDCCFKETKQKE